MEIIYYEETELTQPEFLSPPEQYMRAHTHTHTPHIIHVCGNSDNFSRLSAS